jgi:hypothetical protein
MSRMQTQGKALLVELFEGWRVEAAIGIMTVNADTVVIVTAKTADASEMTTTECSSP